MKKTFKFYALIWLIAIALFNVVCFVTPNETETMTKFGGAFWAGYIFITLALIGQLVCGYFAFKAENAEKLFYRLPLISVSFTGLIVMLIAGALCMAIPDVPAWLGIVICAIVLGVTAIAVSKAAAAAELVEETGNKVKAKTAFIKMLTADADSLVSAAGDPEMKEICRKVYEEIRYSDPMSADGLAGVEWQISMKFAELKKNVEAGSAPLAGKSAEELLALIADRNNRCKLLK